MAEQTPTPQPQESGGFENRESQERNTAFRGMESDATLEEVNAYDQLERDIVNAEHFGYPLGTPSSEIGRDLALGKGPKPE